MPSAQTPSIPVPCVISVPNMLCVASAARPVLFSAAYLLYLCEVDK